MEVFSHMRSKLAGKWSTDEKCTEHIHVFYILYFNILLSFIET